MAKQRDLKESILALREQGLTYNQIKEELECSKSTISYYLGDNQPQKTLERSNALSKAIKDYLRSERESTPCKDCGKYFAYWIMQFDHLPQFEKSFALSKFSSYTKDINVVIAERNKCDVVCANCHAHRGHLRRLAVKRAGDEAFNEEDSPEYGYDFLDEEV